LRAKASASVRARAVIAAVANTDAGATPRVHGAGMTWEGSMKGSRNSALLVGVSTLLMGALNVGDASAQAGARDQQADDGEEIVVVGSRIRRDEFTSSSPIEVITAEEMEIRGIADTATALQTSNIAATGPQQNLSGGGFAITGTTFGGTGTTNVSLRGLGAQRTLVLLNGRRLGPSGVTGFIAPFNPNVLPQSIVQRVEVLKDGASSVYGSDAVAGVVNIMTRTDFDGVSLNFYGSDPTEGGGEMFRVSGAFGRTFDRGYFNVTGEYFEQSALEVGDHEHLVCAADYIHDAATGAIADVIDPDTGQPKCFDNFNWGGATVQGAFYQYDPTNSEGAYGAYANSAFSGAGYRRVGIANNRDSYSLMRSWHPFYGIRNAVIPVERGTIYVTGGYEFSNSLEAYGELLVNRTETNFTIPAPFAPSIAAAHPNNPFGVAASPALVVQRNFLNTVEYARLVAGVRGEFGEGGLLSNWDWDVHVQHAINDAVYESPNIYLDAIRMTDGNNANGECGVGGATTAPISGGACPGVIPWFGSRIMMSVPAGFTQAESDFLFFNSVGTTEYVQTSVEASMSGDVMRLPAGPLQAAVGVFWSSDELDDTPDPRTVANAQLAGATPTRGDSRLFEAFGELAVPLLADAPLAYRLDLSLSGRFTEHDSYGQNGTYKVGADWQLTPEFRLRSTYGTSFRAPAIYERFLSSSFLGFTAQQVDACINWDSNPNLTLRANCQAAGLPAGWNPAATPFTTVSTSGNPNLEPEESTAFTFGFVVAPRSVDLSLAMDYFEIDIEGQISRLFVFPNVRDCYESTSYPSAPECALFVRDANPASTTFRRITSAVDNYVNVASQTNRGVDITAHYGHETPFGQLTLSSQITWILEDVVVSFEGAAPNPRNGEFGYPEIVGNFNIRLDQGPWTFNWNSQYTGPTEQPGSNIGTSVRYPGRPIRLTLDTEEVIYHDFSVRRRYDNFSWQIGMQNIFDEHPPAVSSTILFRRGVSAIPNYDVVGRRAYLSLSANF